LYTPLLFYWARKAGENESDASDLVQEVFVLLVRTLPTFEYGRGGGKFRGWLRTLMLNKLRDRIRGRQREEKALAGHGPMADLPDVAEVFGEREHQRALTLRALRLMQEEFAPTTWKACWETVALGRSAVEVARELGLTENAVYIAKGRVLRRLRQEMGGLLE
jgi:RNA polymerase sigma-70 factor (ECF subfamily)